MVNGPFRGLVLALVPALLLWALVVMVIVLI